MAKEARKHVDFPGFGRAPPHHYPLRRALASSQHLPDRLWCHQAAHHHPTHRQWCLSRSGCQSRPSALPHCPSYASGHQRWSAVSYYTTHEPHQHSPNDDPTGCNKLSPPRDHAYQAITTGSHHFNPLLNSSQRNPSTRRLEIMNATPQHCAQYQGPWASPKCEYRESCQTTTPKGDSNRKPRK